jgi:hypothetical protein
MKIIHFLTSFSLIFTAIYTSPSFARRRDAFLVRPLSPEKIEKKENRTVESGVAVIHNQIDYGYGYDTDEKNFAAASIIPVKDRKAQDWLVMVNAHGPASLNLESRYVPGTRTLSWAIPLKKAINSLTDLSSPHDRLALLKGWSGNKYRKYITFIFVPPRTPMSFKIGLAEEQEGGGEHRVGQGVQMRLRYLPAGSIAVTVPMFGEKRKSIRLSKGEKKINIFNRFKVAAQMARLNLKELQHNYPEKQADGYRSFSEANREWIKGFLQEFFGFRFSRGR